MTVHVLPMISQPLDQEWPGPVVLRRRDERATWGAAGRRSTATGFWRCRHRPGRSWKLRLLTMHLIAF